ncbi:MAG: RNA 2',3'-cyclic phosphodiesterase [Planctomycetota bacterium]
MTGLAEHLRLFTAVLLDPPLRRAIREEAEALLDGTVEKGGGKLGRVREENLHVTLKFIGDVHRDDLPALDETMADAGRRLTPGEIGVEGFGAFPDPRRPRVIWAGVSDPSGILEPVHARLNETLACSRAGFGAKREKKRYVPHVTLARVRSSKGGRIDADLLAERLDEAGDVWMGTQSVEAVALLMSELEKGRPPRYTVLGHYGPQAREAEQAW